MGKKILIGVNWLAAGFLFCALLLAGLMPAEFLSTEDWAEPVTLVVGALGLLIIINGLKKVLALVSDRTYRWLLYGLGALIIVMQLWVALHFIDVARADFYAIRTQAISLAQGSTKWNYYYKVYPHNVNTALFEAMLIRPLLKLGFTSPWIILNVLRFIWIDTGLISGLFIIKHWNRWMPGAFFLMLTWLLSVPVYSYGLVAYNDEIVMPLILNFAVLGWLFKNKTGWLRWTAGVGSWLLLAFAIIMKSNLVVLLIAVIIILMIAIFTHQINLRLALSWILGAMVAFFLVFSVASVMAKNNGYVKEQSKATPVTNWIAMGLNPDTQGEYHSSDFYRIRNAKTFDDRKKIANDSIKDRVKDMGAVGSTVHFSEKFGVFLSHGDFDGINIVSQWIKVPAWYIHHQRSYKFWALLLTQCWYLAMLIGAIWQLLVGRKHLFLMGLLSLSFLGLTAFHVLLWEVEPRYSLPLLPIIMLLGCVGWSSAPRLRFTGNQRSYVSVLAVFSILLSGLAIVQLSMRRPIQAYGVGMQGNGRYFSSTTQNIAAGKSFHFDVDLNGLQNNQLSIYPKSKEKVTIIIRNKRKVLKKVSGNADKVSRINYPTTNASKLSVTITNNDKQPVRYANYIANYSVTTGEIFTKPRMYMQWDVSRVYAQPKEFVNAKAKVKLTPIATIIRNSVIFMVLVLEFIWWEPTRKLNKV